MQVETWLLISISTMAKELSDPHIQTIKCGCLTWLKDCFQVVLHNKVVNTSLEKQIDKTVKFTTYGNPLLAQGRNLKNTNSPREEKEDLCGKKMILVILN